MLPILLSATARKRRLRAAARRGVVPSCDETSSLVAMEAIAAGIPVVAFRVGALPEVVDHGITGYIVDDLAERAAVNTCRFITGSWRMRKRNA